MGVKRLRIDSIKEMKDQKTNEQLAEENKVLREKATMLENSLVSTQEALCDVYEMLIGGDK